MVNHISMLQNTKTPHIPILYSIYRGPLNPCNTKKTRTARKQIAFLRTAGISFLNSTPENPVKQLREMKLHSSRSALLHNVSDLMARIFFVMRFEAMKSGRAMSAGRKCPNGEAGA